MRTSDRRRRSWREDVRHVDLERVGRVRRGRRRFREVVDAVGREEHQRVVPLPLAVAAVLIPFLTARAVAHPVPEPEGTVAASAVARPWTERRPPSGRASCSRAAADAERRPARPGPNAGTGVAYPARVGTLDRTPLLHTVRCRTALAASAELPLLRSRPAVGGLGRTLEAPARGDPRRSAGARGRAGGGRAARRARAAPVRGATPAATPPPEDAAP